MPAIKYQSQDGGIFYSNVRTVSEKSHNDAVMLVLDTTQTQHECYRILAVDGFSKISHRGNKYGDFGQIVGAELYCHR